MQLCVFVIVFVFVFVIVMERSREGVESWERLGGTTPPLTWSFVILIGDYFWPSIKSELEQADPAERGEVKGSGRD